MKIINQPRFLQKEAYDEELDLYLQKANVAEGLVSVMTMGSVGAPGLSDLDLICVVDDGARARTVLNLDLSVGARDRGILIHAPIIVPRSLFIGLDYIFPVSNLSDCKGEPLAQMRESLTKEEESSLALVYLVDFTLSRLVQHSVVRTSAVLDKRSWLTRLWSLTHTENLCNKAGIELLSHWTKLLREIRFVREEWNSGNSCSDGRFLNLYHRLELVHRQLLPVALKAEASILGVKIPDIPLEFRASSRRIICQGKAIPVVVNHSADIWSSVLKVNYHTIYAPSEYAVRLAHYGFQTPETVVLSEGSHGQVLRKRASLVRQYNQFLENSGITFSLRSNLGLPIRRESFVLTLIHKMFWFMQRYRPS
jgi:hypothetical protein